MDARGTPYGYLTDMLQDAIKDRFPGVKRDSEVKITLTVDGVTVYFTDDVDALVDRLDIALTEAYWEY